MIFQLTLQSSFYEGRIKSYYIELYFLFKLLTKTQT